MGYGNDKDPHTMMWSGHGCEEQERRSQQRADAFKAILLERWQDEHIERSMFRTRYNSRAACSYCRENSKKCTNELPACALCVRRATGHSCTYPADKQGLSAIPHTFDVALAKRRIITRHARILRNEITMEQAQHLSIRNMGTAGGSLFLYVYSLWTLHSSLMSLCLQVQQSGPGKMQTRSNIQEKDADNRMRPRKGGSSVWPRPAWIS